MIIFSHKRILGMCICMCVCICIYVYMKFSRYVKSKAFSQITQSNIFNCERSNGESQSLMHRLNRLNRTISHVYIYTLFFLVEYYFRLLPLLSFLSPSSGGSRRTADLIDGSFSAYLQRWVNCFVDRANERAIGLDVTTILR